MTPPSSPSLSVAAWRDLLRDRDPTPEEQSLLEADSRKGIQGLLQTLANRRAKAEAWRARKAQLMQPAQVARERGYVRIGGLDEAGRGPLAGPVFTACVVLPEDWELPGLNDSKKIPKEKRESLAEAILVQAVDYCIDSASAEEIDTYNILQATKRSMVRATQGLVEGAPGFLYTDAVDLPEAKIPFQALVGGDSKVAEVAAASILAKVSRDRYMEHLDQTYPGYGFAQHKGYGTAQHMAALARLGPTPIHRRSFAPVQEWVLPTLEEFTRRLGRCRNLDSLRQAGAEIRRHRADLSEDDLSTLRELYKERETAISQGRR